jgi:sec-independent protein translocase protein TatC
MTTTEQPSTELEVASTEPTHAPGDREMTMLEHLEELRQRLVVATVSVVIGLLVTLIPLPGMQSLTAFVVQLVADSAPGGVLFSIKPGEAFFTYLQVSLVLGVALAMPVLVFQVLAFVSPALYAKEKRYLWIAAPGATLSFLVGVVFCYLVMLPFAISFLGGFAADVIRPTWTAEFYLDFVVGFLFWVGVTFELPIVMYFLAKMGVVTPDRMVKFRKYAFLLAFLIGAIITPTPDPINQTVVSLPVYILFELGIILARFA